MLVYLDDLTCLVPFGWVRTDLILDPYVVSDRKWWLSTSVFRPFLSCFKVSDAEGLLASIKSLLPSRMRFILTGQDRYEVSDVSAEDAHGG